jgi:hypothetical protein
MLSEEEKKEMLEDASSRLRCKHFRAAKNKQNFSFDDYLIFLDNIQKLFSQLPVSHQITHTEFNRL